jgi:UTP--glucose-1-phosphate uridylyltransferase
MKIRKAIIPAAGLGTRFLPATKAMPKEMLPIVDKPTIQYIVEEAVNAGLEDIIIVTGKGKRAIEDHFDHSFELEEYLLRTGKQDLLKVVQESSQLIDIHYIRQKEPKGLGHAILCAKKFIGNEPFAVLLGDMITEEKTNCMKIMIQLYEKYQSSILGIQAVPKHKVSQYGIVSGQMVKEQVFKLSVLVEKPKQEESPSNLAIIGRYILTPKIFEILEQLPPGHGGEIQLTDALSKLKDLESVYAYLIDGNCYDVGEKLGFITTSIEFALQREELRSDLILYLKRVIEDSH